MNERERERKNSTHLGMTRLRVNRLSAFPAAYALHPRECMRRCASGIQPLVFGYSRAGARGRTGDPRAGMRSRESLKCWGIALRG